MIEIITGGERLRPPPALHLRSYSQGLNWKSNTSTDRRYDRIGPGGAIMEKISAPQCFCLDPDLVLKFFLN